MRFLLCIIIVESFFIAPYSPNDPSKSQERLVNTNGMIFSTVGTPMDFTIKTIYTEKRRKVGEALYTENGYFLGLSEGGIQMTQLVPTKDKDTTIDERRSLELNDRDFNALDISLDLLDLHNKVYNIRAVKLKETCLIRNSNKNLSIGQCGDNHQAKFTLIESEKDKKSEKAIKSKEEAKDGGKGTGSKTDANPKAINTETPANTTLIVLNGENAASLDDIQSLISNNKTPLLKVKREGGSEKRRKSLKKRRPQSLSRKRYPSKRKTKPHTSHEEENKDIEEGTTSDSSPDEGYYSQSTEENEMPELKDDNKRQRTRVQPQQQPIVLIPLNQAQSPPIQPLPFNNQAIPSSDNMMPNQLSYYQPLAAQAQNQPITGYSPQAGIDYKNPGYLNSTIPYTPSSSANPSTQQPQQTTLAYPQQTNNQKYFRQLSDLITNGIPVILGNTQQVQNPGIQVANTSSGTVSNFTSQPVPNVAPPGDTQPSKESAIDIKDLQRQLMNILGGHA